MAVYYVDSSAMVKRYVLETGTPWITSLTDSASGNSCWVSALTAVEIVAALYRRVKGATLLLAEAQTAEQQWRAELGALFPTLAVGTVVIDRAIDLASRHHLRGYDALQLASCLLLREQCIMMQHPLPQLISADQELNQAAVAESMAVDDPNLHP